MGYSPSAQTAWESVNYLQSEVFGGWFLLTFYLMRAATLRAKQNPSPAVENLHTITTGR